jgi:outer membrane lipoprotein-sorting protein
MQIRMLSAADSQGGRSTFQFSNYKENLGLSDKTFEFKIPRGADVTNNGSPSR